MTTKLNYAQAVIDGYNTLHLVAPGSDAGRRFLQDMASWAMFCALGTLCRVEKPGKDTERDLLGLASIVGIYARSGGPNWLAETVENTARRLCDPTFREKAEDEERDWARESLSESDLKRATRLQSSGRATMARRNAENIEGAITEFNAYMNSSGTFTRGKALRAHFGPTYAEKFCSKVRKAIGQLPSVEYAFGSPTAAKEIREWLRDPAGSDDLPTLDQLLEKYEPAFDTDWMADNEIASLEEEEAANFERREAELRSIAEDVQSRTSAYRDQFGS